MLPNTGGRFRNVVGCDGSTVQAVQAVQTVSHGSVALRAVNYLFLK